MQNLTSNGENIVNDIAMRYQLSQDAVVHMLIAVNNGGGTMAQFNSPELGGSGQWMRGGMTMVGDMFNGRLQSRVDNLCNELSQALANNQMFPPVPQNSAASNQWWPSELGQASSSGAQNNLRYAVLPQHLALENNGQVSIYDTLDHQISGVSQQQGGDTNLSFTSQYGTIAVSSLPLVSGQLQGPAPSTNFAQSGAFETTAPFQANVPPQSQGEVAPEIAATAQVDSRHAIELIEKLAQLLEAGVLTREEFDTKKRELMEKI
ncbi:MAG: SHOCT domain-containing protein [Cellvibrionaceae bacterium]|nr:SHOCT domain-containing protein [Cellvibrionaceae bacterium]